jgi:hypothetical protein
MNLYQKTFESVVSDINQKSGCSYSSPLFVTMPPSPAEDIVTEVLEFLEDESMHTHTNQSC